MGGRSLSDDEEEAVGSDAAAEIVADVGGGAVRVVLLSLRSLLVRGSRGAIAMGALGAAGLVRAGGWDEAAGMELADVAGADIAAEGSSVSTSLSVSYSDGSLSDSRAASTSNLSHFWYAA